MEEKTVRLKYTRLTRLLIERQKTVTVMESATAGQIASLLTDTEGSSAVFKGSFVAYCNEIKAMLGVPKEVIEQYSVYSEETAAAMAQVCREKFSADIGIGITGTMGNRDPANKEFSKPGEIYWAIAYDGGVRAFHDTILPLESRPEYKLAAADKVADKLLELLEQEIIIENSEERGR